MAFDNRTNQRRVEMLSDTLSMIAKSARSNRADASEVATLLKPFTDELHALLSGASAPVATPEPAEHNGSSPRTIPGSGNLNATPNRPGYQPLDDFVRSIDRDKLCWVLTHVAQRIDDEIFDMTPR